MGAWDQPLVARIVGASAAVARANLLRAGLEHPDRRLVANLLSELGEVCAAGDARVAERARRRGYTEIRTRPRISARSRRDVCEY